MRFEKLRWCPLVIGFLCVTALAQETQLQPGQSVERELAGGESHSYQISLAAGQFVRFRLEQRAIDAALILTAPDGKQPVEMNLTGVGQQESLSLEVAAAGSYRLAVRGNGAEELRGSYSLEAIVQATASAQDSKRLTAEALLVEAKELSKHRGKTAQQVIEKVQQSVSIWRELDEPSWTVYALFMIGSAYKDLSQFGKAVESYEQALAVSREVKDRANEASAFTNLADAYAALSRYEKMIECYEQALAIYREMKNQAREVEVLSGLGNAYSNLNRYEKATEYHEQALAISREVKNRSGEAMALGNLGSVYFFRGLHDKAIEYEEQALAIRREVKDRAGEGTTLNNLAMSYRFLERYDKAIEYHEQAVVVNREVKSLFGETMALSSLGSIYFRLNSYEKAIEYYEQALASSRGMKIRRLEGNTLSSLGSSFASLGRTEKAIEYYEQALAIRREVKDRVNEGSTLNNLGIIYHDLGRYEKAIEYHEQAVVINREVKNRAVEALTLSRLARAEWGRGNLPAARAYIEESLKIAESMRLEFQSPTARAISLENKQRYYQYYTDVLMRQHRAEPSKGFDALAVETSERQRARSLLDQMSEANINLREGVDAVLIEHERAVAKQLNDKAHTRFSTPEQAAALQREISQLETDLERAQVAIRKVSPRYAAMTQPQPLKFKEIQQQLDADTLLLEYALGEERSYLWAITKDSLKSYELPKGELIEKNARLLHELLSARSTTKRGESALQRQVRINQAERQLPATAQALSQMLLAPVAAQLGNKRLVIVADGALQYIPFAMLPDPSVVRRPLSVATNNGQRTTDNGQPLIVTHEIISLPSASALAIQRNELAGRKPAPKMLAVIADPVFDRRDARFKTPAPEGESKPQILASDDERKIEHLADKTDDKSAVTTRQLVIPRLPFTRQEATRLLTLAPKNSSFGAIDFQASRATVLNGDLAQYRYVHFATHGLIDSERPGLSSLVLAMVDSQGKPQDGFLRLHDIYKLKLPAELVVLSACQTGLGKEIKGEGMEALTRGFMYAGAARVMVSLWSVNDKATAELMMKFYEKMLKEGARPAAALRAAQVEMLRQKQWQSPYYWAAFTMQGEWK